MLKVIKMTEGRSQAVTALTNDIQIRFPEVFPSKPKPKVPLAIGIHLELLEALRETPVSKNLITAFLQCWCKGVRYHEAISAGGPRFNLKGQPSGEVTEAHILWAKKQIRPQRPSVIEEAGQ